MQARLYSSTTCYFWFRKRVSHSQNFFDPILNPPFAAVVILTMIRAYRHRMRPSPDCISWNSILLFSSSLHLLVGSPTLHIWWVLSDTDRTQINLRTGFLFYFYLLGRQIILPSTLPSLLLIIFLTAGFMILNVIFILVAPVCSWCSTTPILPTS